MNLLVKTTMDAVRNQREEALLNRLMTVKRLSMQDAIDLLGVSKSTARRIFIDLEKRGTVVRSYGGIQLAFGNAYSFEALQQKYSEEKARIGKAACELVEPNDMIFIDAGTTSMNFAFQLAQAISKGTASVKSIFTNSTSTLEVLSPVTTVNLIGGEYRSYRKDFHGYLTTLVINHVHFTKCFLGTDGVINQKHFAAMDFSTADLNAALLKNSTSSIVLCDHSKFYSESLVSWAPLSSISTVITDTGLDEEVAARIRAEGCQLIRV